MDTIKADGLHPVSDDKRIPCIINRMGASGGFMEGYGWIWYSDCHSRKYVSFFRILTQSFLVLVCLIANGTPTPIWVPFGIPTVTLANFSWIRKHAIIFYDNCTIGTYSCCFAHS